MHQQIYPDARHPDWDDWWPEAWHLPAAAKLKDADVLSACEDHLSRPEIMNIGVWGWTGGSHLLKKRSDKGGTGMTSFLPWFTNSIYGKRLWQFPSTQYPQEQVVKTIVTLLGLLLSAILFIERSTLPRRWSHTVAVTSDKWGKNHQQVCEEFSLFFLFLSYRDGGICAFLSSWGKVSLTLF